MTNKCEAIKRYWVYSIYVPSVAKYYIGVSKQQCNQRWKKSYYKDKSLSNYLNEWDSMIKTVLINGLSKEEALIYEDALIQALSKKGLCINEYRSGLIRVSDVKSYNKQYYENNKKKISERSRERYHKNKQNNEWVEEVNRKQRERYHKRKLEQQQNQLNLF